MQCNTHGASDPNSSRPCKRLAIIGAGPIGIELALSAVMRGVAVSVFESGETVGAQVLSWRHVTMFSPWSMNMSDAGRRVLEQNGLQLPDGDRFPTGAEFVSCYLRPIAEHIRKHPFCDSWNLNARVVSVGRGALLKGESIGGGDLHMPVGKPHVTQPRAATPFRLLVSHGGSEALEKYHEGFDHVCDCSGCYRLPCVMRVVWLQL